MVRGYYGRSWIPGSMALTFSIRYSLFTKIITTRLEKKLDENQPREQAGFRSKYSTTDHIDGNSEEHFMLRLLTTSM